MDDMRHQETLHYFGQMLNDDSARVIRDALLVHAVTTVGRDRAIAQELANLFNLGE